MTTDHSSIVRFFKTCYQADNRETAVWDVFSTKHEFQKTLTETDFQTIISGHPAELPNDYGSGLEYAVSTYRREKQLLLGGLFIAGRVSGISSFGSSSKKVCAPLILFDASLEKQGDRVFLTADPDSYRWNTSLISILVENRDEIHDLETAVSVNDVLSGDIEGIGSWLKAREGDNRITRIDSGHAEESTLKSAAGRQKKSGLTLLNGASVVLTARSRASRGIIDELETISESPDLSPPLLQLLTRKELPLNHARVPGPDIDNVPGILSSAQETALNNAARYTLSLLIGPPGTGKSYTIACMALERFLAGESVLIVSENEHAVDVVLEKLVEQLGVSANAVLRAGKRDYHKYLITYIDNLTKGIGVDDPGEPVKPKLDRIRKTIRKLENQFERISGKAVSDGIYLDRVLSKGTSNPIERFCLWCQKRRTRKFGLLHEQLDRIQSAYRNRERLLSLHINRIHTKNVHKTMALHRAELVSFLSGLKARTSSRQEKMFSEIDYSILLKTMPIWLCSMDALSKALPLRTGLFDLVIIDEATQCDFASCIPALFRAKRGVIVGDPKQLRHVSFLSRKKQEMIRRKLNIETSSIELNFRDNSMIDFADQAIGSQGAVTMLDEHYRSLPDIIRFSNHRFYHDKLRIMTEKPLQIASRPVTVIRVAEGRRVNGVNDNEANAVMEKLNELVTSQEQVPPAYKVSIGLLSFFRDQAETLQKRLLDTFPVEVIAGHRLRAGTPYAFQGEERDIMLISSGVGPDENGATWHYLNRQDVFNVAITRARHCQYLFLSADESELPEKTLMHDYVTSINRKSYDGPGSMPARDSNIDALASELSRKGLTVLRDFPVAGIPMDLVATRGVNALAIDVIGFPGEFQDVFHLDRYKLFERAGLKIFPLSFTAWTYNKASVLDTILNEFESMDTRGPSITVTADSLTSHWHTLLAVNPDLAKTVRTLEFSLSSIGDDRALTQTGRLIERYRKLIWLLGEKLNPDELTYSRYLSAAEAVLLGGLDNLGVIVKMRKSMPDERGDADMDGSLDVANEHLSKQKEAINRLLVLNDAAIQQLETIAMEWSRVDTGSSGAVLPLETSLTELERLTKNVRHYSR